MTKALETKVLSLSDFHGNRVRKLHPNQTCPQRGEMDASLSYLLLAKLKKNSADDVKSQKRQLESILPADRGVN